MDALLLGEPAALLEEAVEALDLGEERGVGEVAIDDADRVVRIDRRDQRVAGLRDRLHVARRDEACRTDEREVVCHGSNLLLDGDRRHARAVTWDPAASA